MGAGLHHSDLGVPDKPGLQMFIKLCTSFQVLLYNESVVRHAERCALYWREPTNDY